VVGLLQKGAPVLCKVFFNLKESLLLPAAECTRLGRFLKNYTNTT
jgi:hypothetical protein